MSWISEVAEEVHNVCNIANEQAMKMFDSLTRLNEQRHIRPLGQWNYIPYNHRQLYDEYHLMIGDVSLMIPPEFIYVSSESFSQNIQTLRQENSQKQKTGYHKRTIQIDLIFNGMDEINGYKVESPIHEDGTEQTHYYYVDGLRTLLAEFKCTPFLPIENDLLNQAYSIYTVALQSIVIDVIDGFQNAVKAHITLQEIDVSPYIEDNSIALRDMIDWDLFRYYTQSFLTQNYRYKYLQALPKNSDHTAFKLSIVNESVLKMPDGETTVKDTSTSTREETILRRILNPENYNCLINSEESDVHITSFQCQYSNMLTSIQMSNSSTPTLQYLGGLDTTFGITFETNDVNVVASIEQCQILNDLMVRNNPKVRGSIGFVKLETDFVAFCGSLFCTVESVETHTVQGIPGLYEVRMLCVSYDIAQSRKEDLEGFMPFSDAYVSNIDDLDANLLSSDMVYKVVDDAGLTDETQKGIHRNTYQCIDQSMEGLMKKIYQDNYAEYKLRTEMEVYPDLRLPTYSEVNTAIKRINDFRQKNGLEILPYSEYPLQPTNMMYGVSETKKEYANYWEDRYRGFDVYYIDGTHPEEPKGDKIYNIYVDPDFYVFYPNSYLNSYKQGQEENDQKEQSAGTTSKDIYRTPTKITANSTEKIEEVKPVVGGGDGNETAVDQFIQLLRQNLGHSFCAFAEGEVSDHIGRQFDDLGLITFALKQLGKLPNNSKRLSYRKLKTMDIFEKLKNKNDLKRGDIIVNTIGTNCCVCTGYDGTGNISVIEVTMKDGVVEGQLRFEIGNIYRILPLQEDYKGNGTEQSDPYDIEKDKYPDANKKIKEKEAKAIDTVEGYTSKNPYGDDDAQTNNASSTTQTNNTSSSSNNNTANGSTEEFRNQDLKVWAPITEKELNDYIASVRPDSPFARNAKVFLDAAKETGLDPRYILAHAAVESGWGTSAICKDKNNYFGIGAFDSSPYASAYSFSSGLAAGIIEGAKWIEQNYYSSSYKQTTLKQMRWNNGQHQYATDSKWDTTIASIMSNMPNSDNKTTHTGTPGSTSKTASSGATTTANSKNTNNSAQAILNEYDRRNRTENYKQLQEEFKSPELEQADISELELPEVEADHSNPSDGSVTQTRERTMTTDEFSALALTVAAECEGEPIEVKMAMAQLLYDLSQEKYKGNGITLITQSNYFTADRSDVEEKDINEAKQCVKDVFENGKRWKKDYIVMAFTSVGNSNMANMNRENQYQFIKSVGQHSFYGTTKTQELINEQDDHTVTTVEKEREEIKYKVHGHGVSDCSSNAFNKKVISMIKENQPPGEMTFGKPIYIKPSYFDSHKGSKGREWHNIDVDNSVKIATSFVDDCQYSAKGRLVKAFPTFLFCILDDSAQWFDGRKLWANYYTYKPVVDIQYHAANDMPTETATITITNTYHNLDRNDAALTNYSPAEDLHGFNKWLYKNTGMIMGGTKITPRLIQLHSIIFDHAKLREGTRVHLRIGYGSDPMSLAPIINGTVSGITLGDQISIVVTSDGHELIQAVTSDKTKDKNNGAFGLFGLGATQEASNIIAKILLKRESWMNHLFFGKNWFEGSKYHIEHFGLYINDGDEYSFQGGIDTGIQEQWDILMNIYNATTGNRFGHWLYMYYNDGILPNRDGEANIVFNQYNMTPWDVFQLCAQTTPEFIVKAEKYQFDSRLFFGLPFDLTKYRYDIIDGIVYQECKANTQMHYIDSIGSIIENQVSVSSKRTFTNAKVMYTCGKSPKATPIIHSDDTIDNSKQRTQIIDSCITQDYIGFDAAYEWTGISRQGKNSARKLGISNLLYGWQQQYQGQILCLGSPQIKPDDYIMVNDFYTSLNGLAVVREVIHSFSTGTGFTTSIIPGIIGFCPEQESGNIELISSFLRLYSQFTQFATDKKTIMDNAQRYSDVIAKARAIETRNNSIQFWSNVNAGVTIAKTVMTASVIYDTIVVLRSAENLLKGIQTIYATTKAISMSTKALKVTKTTIRTISVIKNLAQGVRVGATLSDVSAGIMAGGVAGGPVGIAVALVVTIAIDFALDAVMTWVKNKNTVLLLPLWWEGKPFISGIKDGEKILLIKDENTGTEENTEEEGREVSVEDN